MGTEGDNLLSPGEESLETNLGGSQEGSQDRAVMPTEVLKQGQEDTQGTRIRVIDPRPHIWTTVLKGPGLEPSGVG